MQKVIVAAVLAAACGLVDAAPMPDMTLPGVGGSANQRLEEQRGHPVLLVFTAPWCGHCTGYIRQLDGVLDAADSGARLWLMDLGEADTAPMKLDHAHAAHLRDADGRLARRLHIDDLPAWLLIDANGELHAEGGANDGPEMPLAALAEVLR